MAGGHADDIHAASSFSIPKQMLRLRGLIKEVLNQELEL